MNTPLNSSPGRIPPMGRIEPNALSLSADPRMAQAVERLAASRSALIVCMAPHSPESSDPNDAPAGQTGAEPHFADLLTARIQRKGLLQGSWLTARILARRWWNRQPWHSSVELVGQTLAHQARPLMRSYPLATLGVGAALGGVVVMAVTVGRPRMMQHIHQQATPWRDRMGSLLWAQLTAAPVQMALAGALAAWLADQGNRNTPSSNSHATEPLDPRTAHGG